MATSQTNFNSVEEVAALLASMGQQNHPTLSGDQGHGGVPTSDLLSSEAGVRALLTSAGQRSHPAPSTVTPLAPSLSVFPDLPNTLDGTKAMLSAMVNGAANASGSSGTLRTGSLPSNLITSAADAQALLALMGQTNHPSPSVVTPLPLGAATMPKLPNTLGGIQALLASMANGTAKALQPEAAPAPAAPAPPATPAPVVEAPKPAPPVDPLAADANGWNLPKTGEVNTKGAEQRINARTAMHGVTATYDMNGRLVLTNVEVPAGGDPMAIPTSPSAGNVAGLVPNVSSTLQSAAARISEAPTAEAAAAGLASFRISAATEAARIQEQAATLASKKLGVPGLERSLMEAEAADKDSYGWYPGIGDSPDTAKVRQALNATRMAADAEAARLLAGNTQMAGLRATLANAEAGAERVVRNADRLTSLGDSRSARTADKLETRKMEEDMKAADILATLTPEVTKRLTLLNPQFEHTGNAARDMATLALAASKNKDRTAVLTANEADIPILALAGNPDAERLVIAEEKTSSGATDAAVQAKLTNLRAFANAPDFAAKYIKGKYGAQAESDEAKAELAAMNAPTYGLSAADKAARTEMRYQVALDMERKAATGRAQADLSSWRTQDPSFAIALAEAQKATGGASLENVLASYIGTLSGPEALAKGAAFAAIMESSLKGTGSKTFGSPDLVAIRAAIQKQAVLLARPTLKWGDAFGMSR